MKRKRVLTRRDGQCINAVWEDGISTELSLMDFDRAPILDRIYVGRVQNIVANIGAVFVEYEKGKTAYLELTKCPGVKIGDIFPVQITREAAGSKPPRCSAELSIKGQFLVLVQGSGKAAVSSKIAAPQKRALREWILPFVTEDYGWIVRTMGAQAEEEALLREKSRLEELHGKIKRARYHEPFELLYQPMPLWLEEIRDRDLLMETEIITDQKDLYESLLPLMKEYPKAAGTLRFYEDDRLPLFRLYSLSALLEECLGKRVWLRSGAYLVIEQTEAMAVIDVNSGKAIKGKADREAALLAINKEAAKEVFRQMRLRNLSGIIVVDFIDLKKEGEALLTELLKELAKADPVKCDFVEMSRLHFAVFTREKVRMPLADQFRMEQKKEKNLENMKKTD